VARELDEIPLLHGLAQPQRLSIEHNATTTDDSRRTRRSTEELAIVEGEDPDGESSRKGDHPARVARARTRRDSSVRVSIICMNILYF
jgi:hypothetical protein